MSVYKSDSSTHLEIAIQSILNQTYRDFDLFVECDGPVSNNIKHTLDTFAGLDNVYINYNEFNSGLASRLNQIVNKAIDKDCYEFIARMDADDISNENRFKKQVDFLLTHTDISVVGSDVVEISDNGVELFYKKMDSNHADMFENIIKKCPFNHPTVMFRISVFDNGLRYNSRLKNTQDYYLWVDLLALNAKFANVNEPLLKFRVNDSFHSRRGLKKALNDVNSRLYAFKKLDVCTISNILHTFLLFLLRISPSFIKSFAYNKFR